MLIANGFLDGQLRSGELGILCKLEMEKAYDHANWGLLHDLLGRCGLGSGGVLGLCTASPVDFFINSLG